MADRSYVEPGYQTLSSSVDSKRYAASHASAQTKALRILVVGVAGSGKSTFISCASGHDVGIGHGAGSCTQVCSVYRSQYDVGGTQFDLIDTPGFDDPHRNDFDILKDISKTLDDVSGIVYCHRITDTRLTGDSKLNLEIIKAMCGKRFYGRVVICSTMWDTLPQNVTQQQLEGHRARMEQLLSTGFRSLMEKGAKYVEFKADQPDPCLDILKFFSSLRFPPKMAILEQLSQSRGVRETSPGRVIEDEHRRRVMEERPQRKDSAKVRDPEHRGALKKQQRDNDYDGRDPGQSQPSILKKGINLFRSS
ncbi:P-loop containing nucleoside triphosphate hydrolase protein [Hypoxylon crocopeplum]|nr:P-loop containing nucleoside triphosphate hydrolase protein [Hypoxylon crocopeplum]